MGIWPGGNNHGDWIVPREKEGGLIFLLFFPDQDMEHIVIVIFIKVTWRFYYMHHGTLSFSLCVCVNICARWMNGKMDGWMVNKVSWRAEDTYIQKPGQTKTGEIKNDYSSVRSGLRINQSINQLTNSSSQGDKKQWTRDSPWWILSRWTERVSTDYRSINYPPHIILCSQLKETHQFPKLSVYGVWHGSSGR